MRSGGIEQGASRKASDILDALDGSIDTVMDPGYRIERLECSGKLHMLRGNFGTAVQQYELSSSFAGAEQVFQYTRAHTDSLMLS
jgi:hypothetical protein